MEAEAKQGRRTPERDPEAKAIARRMVGQFDVRAELAAETYRHVELF